MRRGQGIIEYTFMIGMAAAVIIAMTAYAKRGFQGHIRDASEQIGAGQYSTEDTTIDNNVVKTVESESVFTTISTTIHGNGQSQSAEMQANSAAQTVIRDNLAVLQEARSNQINYQATTEAITARGTGGNPTQVVNNVNAAPGIRQMIADKTAELNALITRYNELQTERERLDTEYRDLQDQLEGGGWGGLSKEERLRIEGEMRTNRTSYRVVVREQNQNWAQQNQLRTELTALNMALQNALDNPITYVGSSTTPFIPTSTVDPTGMTLAQIEAAITAQTTALNTLQDAYDLLAAAWNGRAIIPDQTSSNSSNIESGTQEINSLTDESLGSLENDAW